MYREEEGGGWWRWGEGVRGVELGWRGGGVREWQANM